MHLIPALDVRGQVVVRGVGGRRSEYRPLASALTDSTDPFDVATAMRNKLAPRGSRGAKWIYVADLDAIVGSPFASNGSYLERLAAADFQVWLDAGVRSTDDAIRYSVHVDRVIIASETLGDSATLREVIQCLGPDRAVFSLDLRDGHPMSCREEWKTAEPLAIAEQVIAAGCTQMIVLDLARVGVGEGTGTEDLCREIICRHPQLDMYVGGGIRDWDDVRRLESLGVSGVLVASALHDGTLAPITDQ